MDEREGVAREVVKYTHLGLRFSGGQGHFLVCSSRVQPFDNSFVSSAFHFVTACYAALSNVVQMCLYVVVCSQNIRLLAGYEREFVNRSTSFAGFLVRQKFI